MKKYIFLASILVLVIAGLVVSQGFFTRRFSEILTGYEETPLALSTTGNGEFRGRIINSDDQNSIEYELSYAELEGSITQAHIHFGAVGQSGGISAWLCGTASNPGPLGTQTCPPAPGTITGTILPTDVVGPAGQGIAAGEFDELVRAVRNGATYVNIHTTKYPPGEIRSQIELNRGGREDHGDH